MWQVHKILSNTSCPEQIIKLSNNKGIDIYKLKQKN
jgi:hypothetical protein